MRRLLIRPGAIGDCIVSLPALEFLRTDFTEVWVAGQNLPLIRFADRVRSIAGTGLDLIELGQAPPLLFDHLMDFDEIVSWYGAGRAEFRDAVEALPFRFLPALPPDVGIHAVDFYLEQVGAPPGSTPGIPVTRTPGGYVVVHPFSGNRSKNWPLDHFRELVAQLDDHAPVHWCAGPEEPLDAAVRFDDLGALAQWLAGARLYVGNDSGITHLAAAVGTPVVTLFGNTDPAVWAPRGSHVHLLHRRPLGALSVEEVRRLCDLVLSMW